MGRRGMTIGYQLLTILYFLVVAACVVFAVSFMAKQYFEIPVVQYSAATGECVQVIPAEHKCDNLPAKYITEWVR